MTVPVPSTAARRALHMRSSRTSRCDWNVTPLGAEMIPSIKPVLPDRNRCDSIAAKPCQISGNTLEPEPDQTNPAALAHVQAMRAAEGVGVPQSWNAALDYVQRSAELGFRPAQAELAALAGEWHLAEQIEAGRQETATAW